MEPKFENLWYDSWWLQTYYQVRQYLEQNEPSKVEPFEKLIEPLRTNKNFKTKVIKSFLDRDTVCNIREFISALKDSDKNSSEFFAFGRHLLRNAEYFNALQLDLMERVEEMVGEELEPSYNFLSLYNNLGSCSPHMDSPEAKWTLDICIDQSDIWPISFSDVIDWPVELVANSDEQAFCAELASRRYDTIGMEVGDAVIFSGSSQWHYRDSIPKVSENNFCNLIFMHFIPRGSANAANVKRWAQYLDEPNVGLIVEKIRSQMTK